MEIFVCVGRMEVFFYDFLIICLICTAQCMCATPTHKLLQLCKQVVTNLFTSCQQIVFALLVPCCCNKFGTSC